MGSVYVRQSRHDIYGSARLGTKEYLPRQVYRSMVVGPGGVERDTNALADRKPWFGLETGAVMQPTAQGPYSAVELGAYAAQRAAGLRQYEIADHLGNVKATVTDLPALSQQAGQLKKGPAIKAAYDHYPFGMFMPGRYVQDSADRCMTVAQERWLTRWETVCKGRAEWPWQGDLPGGSAYVGPVDNYIWAYMTGSSQKASFRVDAPTVGEGMVATLEVAYVNQAAKVYVVEHGPSGDVLLAARDIYSGGSYPMMFVPSTANITIDIVGPTDMGLYRLCFDKLVSEQQTVIVDVCDKVKDSYPYGYNGQEKVNEIAGPGNHNTAEFWEYDTRIARRWNVDPVVKPWRSAYDAFANSPVWKKDPNGDDDYQVNSRGFIKKIASDNSESDRLIYGNKIKFNKDGSLKNDFSVVDKGIIEGRIDYSKNKGVGWRLDFKHDITKAQEVYEKLTFNGTVEFAIVKVQTTDGGSNSVYTSHSSIKEVNSGRGILKIIRNSEFFEKNVTSIEHRHNHPSRIDGGTAGPS